MMNKHIKKWFSAAMVAAVIASISSCRKMFDTLPEQKPDEVQMYRNVYDADAAVIGLYGKLMGLAKQYVILNELRADLMEVTSNADKYLQQISTHSVEKDNPYGSPRPFYELILNCNDVLKNFKIMLADKKFSADQYQQRYSDVGALRSWLYLQVGIHFGTVPYVTDALESVDAVKDASHYPRVSFEVLLDSLINFTEALPYKTPYAAGTSLITTVDGLNTAKFFINKKCLLGDLYLWRTAFKPNNTADYRMAAQNYKDVMETYSGSSNLNELLDYYKVRFADASTNNDLCIGYVRYREMDVNAFIDNNSQGWRAMFAAPQGNLYNQEWIWLLHFDKSFKPVNPFVDLFSNTGGSYLVKPSKSAIDGWNSQMQYNGFPYDGRKLLTYKELNGQPVIMKYLYNYVGEFTYTPINLLERPGKWFLYRAAQLHLHYAEAANRDNRHRIAYAFVNNGIKDNFDNAPGTGTSRDVTNTQQTFDSYPYNFDARFGDYPNYRSPWHRHAGVRGRAYLPVLPVTSDSTTSIEEQIVDESGRELAYEGCRWPDLLRVTIRKGQPQYLADKVFDKLNKDGIGAAATVRSKLAAKDWYLPFTW
jgi:hypothetical protein